METPHDVIVVGGGILGAGILQAAAARGYDAVGLESRGIAAATSSRSSKLIHGGLRYLETFQFSLVRESLRERRTLRRIAPDLVRLVPFHLPVYRDSRRGPLTIRAGLSLYALLGGLRGPNRFRSVPRSEWSGLDGLECENLRAVYRYHDGQTDDAALTRAVVASAEELGAEFIAPAEFLSAERRDGAWHVITREGTREETRATRALVIAAGPWTNDLRALCSPAPPPLPLELVQGTHIEVPGQLERGIYYVEGQGDRRPLFVMPWRDRTLVGTTETLRATAAECAPDPSEIEYLARTFTQYFPGRSAEILDSWSGLRVLDRRGEGEEDANRRSREVIVDLVEEDGTLLQTVAGGKLTGYRAIAEERVEELARVLPARTIRARTDELALVPVDAQVVEWISSGTENASKSGGTG